MNVARKGAPAFVAKLNEVAEAAGLSEGEHEGIVRATIMSNANAGRNLPGDAAH